MGRARGFTIIEVVIVIAIMAILSVVAVPVYRGYTHRAMAAEGKALVNALKRAEKAYLAEHKVYRNVSPATGYDQVLGVDARDNKYFRSYTVSSSGSVTTNNASLTITANGVADATGVTVTLVQNWNDLPTVTVSGAE